MSLKFGRNTSICFCQNRTTEHCCYSFPMHSYLCCLLFTMSPQSHHNILCLAWWHLLDEFRKLLMTHHSSHYLDFKKKISSVCQREMWPRYISIYTDLVTYLASNILCSMEKTIQIPIPVFKNKQRGTPKRSMISNRFLQMEEHVMIH